MVKWSIIHTSNTALYMQILSNVGQSDYWCDLVYNLGHWTAYNPVLFFFFFAFVSNITLFIINPVFFSLLYVFVFMYGLSCTVNCLFYFFLSCLCIYVRFLFSCTVNLFVYLCLCTYVLCSMSYMYELFFQQFCLVIFKFIAIHISVEHLMMSAEIIIVSGISSLTEHLTTLFSSLSVV